MCEIELLNDCFCFFLQDLIVMGAPGSFYWTGSLFVYNITTNKYKAFLDKHNQVKFGSYLGTIKTEKLKLSQSYKC